jgi:hypothetical protein
MWAMTVMPGSASKHLYRAVYGRVAGFEDVDIVVENARLLSVLPASHASMPTAQGVMRSTKQ